MPMLFDNTPDYTLRGLFRPELDYLGHLPVWTPALVAALAALAVVAVSTLARWRCRPPSPCIPGGSMSREEALGHLRRVKAELKGRQGEAAVAAVLARAGFPALHDVIVRDARGLTQVDHLVRLADGIGVLETKAHGGTVTGDVWGQHWVQAFRGGRGWTAFPNPARQNHRQAFDGCGVVAALLAFLPALAVGQDRRHASGRGRAAPGTGRLEPVTGAALLCYRRRAGAACLRGALQGRS